MEPGVATIEHDSRSGIVSQRSGRSVDDTVEHIKSLLSKKGITLFAFLDHSGAADKVGMRLRPTKLLVFGSPVTGTPLMQAYPRMAIDLPLKILVWQDDDATVWMSYNDPAEFSKRYGLPPSLLAPIEAVETLVHAVAISR